MPELPEVEVVCRRLREVVLGLDIKDLIYKPSKVTGNGFDLKHHLVGLRFVAIDRVGKLIIFKTTDPQVNVLCHLKMTGQLIFLSDQNKTGGGHTLSPADLSLPNKHTRLRLEFVGGGTLYFNDMRKFGYFKLADERAVTKAVSGYGVEPISKSYKFDKFYSELKKRKTNLKAFLLNQKILAGLGNIYVDEACHQAYLLPSRACYSLNEQEAKLLFRACRDVLLRSIKVGGTTFYSFFNPDGKKGGFIKYLQVFQRQGEPCYRCGDLVKKNKLAGRGTHFCEGCQK